MYYIDKIILQAHNQLVAMLEKDNFTVDDTQNIAGDVSLPIKKLREKDIRIILGNFNETWARKVFCEAYRSAWFCHYKLSFSFQKYFLTSKSQKNVKIFLIKCKSQGIM